MTDFVDIKAASLEELDEVKALREQIFVKEEGVPYDAEFDGNELGAVHLLARVDGEPVGTMRIRGFGDFVKFERACVIQKFRKTNVASLLMDTAAKYCAVMGYRKASWLCEEALVSRWQKMGAYVNKEIKPSVQHGVKLITMRYDLPEVKQKININTNPEILNKKAGYWFDEPIFGRFELVTKAQKQRFEALSRRVKLLKNRNEKQVDDWHPPLKDWHPPLKAQAKTR